jgi:hypothetical protein
LKNVRNVSLPEELCRSAEKMLGRRFGSIDELITTLLQELLRDEATQMDEKELAIIEQRLRELGYV